MSKPISTNWTVLFAVTLVLISIGIFAVVSLNTYKLDTLKKAEISETQYQRVAEWMIIYPELKVMASTYWQDNKLNNEDFLFIAKQYEYLKELKQKEYYVSTSKQFANLVTYTEPKEIKVCGYE
jgi:hypothetical protein